MTAAATIREFCDRLWTGEVGVECFTRNMRTGEPLSGPTSSSAGILEAYNDRRPEELADGILYRKGGAASTILDTGESLVMLDTGTRGDTAELHQQVRAWRPHSPLAAAVYSHHHIDHIFGVPPFEQEALERRWPAPIVYAHELIPDHFHRYEKTPGRNAANNRRQFAQGGEISPLIPFDNVYRYPDVTYQDRLSFRAGRLTFELHHARGETEDATWTWVPEVKLLATGDLFIWAVPNAGNPQKVQRWVGDWAAALRQMAGMGAELMVPGHGWPIFGADRIQTALSDTATLLESIEGQTLALMEQGASLDTCLHEVQIPTSLLDKPYLHPVYDHPQFLIRSVWRYFGGWYDGEPDNLLPAPRSEQAREWVALAGGIQNVLARARELMLDGNLQLACHLAEYAVRAEPTAAAVHELRAELYEQRAKGERAEMAQGIFLFASASSRIGKRDAFDG